MKFCMTGGAFAALLMMLASGVASAQAVVPEGDSRSDVTAHVREAAGNFEVTDANGGWFENGLILRQRGGPTGPFAVTGRLRVLSTHRSFQVRLDDAVVISNTRKPALTFRQPRVTLGADSEDQKQLDVGVDVSFQNPAPPKPDEDSVGLYDLNIMAYQPEGEFKDLLGTYSGVLSLTFEPVVRAP